MIPRHEVMCAVTEIHLRLMIAIRLTGREAIEIVNGIVIILPRKSTAALADWNCSDCLVCVMRKICEEMFKGMTRIFLNLPLTISVTLMTISFVEPQRIVSLRSRSPGEF